MSTNSLTVGLSSAAVASSAGTTRRPRVSGLRRVLTAALGPRMYHALRQAQWAATSDFRDRRYSWSEKLWAWRRGFTASSAALYDFPRQDCREYLSDYVRENQGVTINAVPQVFDQKLMLRAVLLHHGFAQAETVALVGLADAQLDPLGPGSRLASLSELEEMLRLDGGPFIVKPQDSGFGYGVSLVEARNGELVKRRGHRSTPFHVKPWRASTLIERAIPQHEFWVRLFPESANTMRLLTMWTPGDAEPFIAAAAQRIGASDTAPTDNFHGGGTAAPIDLASGTLGAARGFAADGRALRLSSHAETGASIEGVTLPFWKEIRETVLRAAKLFGIARYVGWDVLVNADGIPVIIEGNANTGIHILQLDRGLLKDPAARRFYEMFGVL
jgi:hypothetical protein